MAKIYQIVIRLSVIAFVFINIIGAYAGEHPEDHVESPLIVVTARRMTAVQWAALDRCKADANRTGGPLEVCDNMIGAFNAENDSALVSGQTVPFCRRSNGACVAEEPVTGQPANSVGGVAANSDVTDQTQGQCYYQAGQRICPPTNGNQEENVTGSIGPEGLPSTAANSPTQISSLLERYDAECKPKLTTAERCCRNPDQCLGDSSGDGDNSAILGSIQAILGAAGQASAISGACGKMRNVALSSAALNGVLARNCSSKISQCKQSCNSVREEASRILASCQSGTTCANTTPLENRSRLRVITSEERSCEANESYAQQQASQTIASALTAKTMGLCKEAATSPTKPVGNNVALNNLNIDCSNPASASNPACQNACNRAGAQNDPACNPALGGGNGFGAGGSGGLVDPNGKANLGSSALDEIEAGQDALAEDIAPVASKIASSSPGGAASLGGGGEDSGGGGLKNSGANSEGTLIDMRGIGSGFRSGSGYISPSGRSVASNSGSGGFDMSALSRMQDGGKPFNPKDYLPGGRLDPKRRLAGLGAANAEIGAVHGDIFKNITNRFYQVCLRDALMDCDTLRKAGKLGK